MTKARKFAEDFFETDALDGQVFSAPDSPEGRPSQKRMLDSELHSTYRTPGSDIVAYYDDQAGHIKAIWDDGSSIVIAGDAWDFGLSPDGECMCWEGVGYHQPSCPLSSEYIAD